LGKRGRKSRRTSGGDPLAGAPTAEIALASGGELVLRCALTPKSREQYRKVIEGHSARPGATLEDNWQRAVEYLFERLVVGWTVAEVEYTDQRELLQRFRVASREERSEVRDALREHLADWFPEMTAP
jgi:hypothetical protein